MTTPDPANAALAGTSHSPGDDGRRDAISTFARATEDELKQGLEAAGCDADCEFLRKPEIGMVMARGRISGTGRPFNLGEVTVTRAAVRLPDGTTGFSYLMGRDTERARLAAVADAHWQRAAMREAVEAHVLSPVRERLAAANARRRAEVAATQVDFFTMVRAMTEMQTATLSAGFAEPVTDAQSVFRTVMMALALPGQIKTVPLVPDAPAAMPPAMAAITLTLTDYETPVWLDDALAGDAAVRQFLAFQTGAPLTTASEDAAFAFVGAPASCRRSAHLPRVVLPIPTARRRLWLVLMA